MTVLGKESIGIFPKDPETGLPYEYEITNASAYRLCAVFATTSSDKDHRTSDYYLPYYRNREHGLGRYCFDLTPPQPQQNDDRKR